MTAGDNNEKCSSKIYAEDGYDYLDKNFPLLDLINQCYLLEEFYLSS